MWRKHQSVIQEHLKYIRNDTVKPLCVGIVHYTDRVEEMHDLANHLSTPSMKGKSLDADNC